LAARVSEWKIRPSACTESSGYPGSHLFWRIRTCVHVGFVRERMEIPPRRMRWKQRLPG